MHQSPEEAKRTWPCRVHRELRIGPLRGNGDEEVPRMVQRAQRIVVDPDQKLNRKYRINNGFAKELRKSNIPLLRTSSSVDEGFA